MEKNTHRPGSSNQPPHDRPSLSRPGLVYLETDSSGQVPAFQLITSQDETGLEEFGALSNWGLTSSHQVFPENVKCQCVQES